MDEPDCGRSRELDRARELLFPNLAPSEGWARIDAAMAGAEDEERWERIDAMARREQLDAALTAELRATLRASRPAEPGER
jgi:hypothetical protein